MNAGNYGQLPLGWQTKPLKHAVQLNPEVLPDTTPADEVLHYVDIAALEGGSTDLTPKALVFAEAPSRARRVLRDGDTILSTVRTYLKAVASFPAVESNLIASTGFAVLRPNGVLFPRFAYWAALAEPFIENVVAHSTGVSYPAINPSTLGDLPIVVPPLPQQERIANFLDDKTARIDALIAEKERLVEKLGEYASALESDAVLTQPNLVPLKYLKSSLPNAFVDGPFGSNLKSEHYVDDGEILVIESNFATTGQLQESQLKRISEAHFDTILRSEVRPGDIVIAKIGARYGMASILPQLSSRAVISGNSMKFTCNESRVLSKYLLLALRVLKNEGAFENIVNLTAQPALSLGGMAELRIPLPSLPEQHQVLERLAQSLEPAQELVLTAERHISLLREYRSSLISAAVTGQIRID